MFREENIKKVQVNVPRMSDFDIDIGINSILSREDRLRKMNELIITDENERIMRNLFNRLDKIIRYMNEFADDTETGGIKPRVVIDLANGRDMSYWKGFISEKEYKIISGDVKDD